MKKTLTLFFILALSSITLFADDTYRLSYNNDSNCTLLKNGKKIPLFDPRFERKEPKSSYTCSSIQKEKYNDCIVINKENLTAQFFGYGAYNNTNLIITFKNPSSSVKSFIEIKCTKSLVKSK